MGPDSRDLSGPLPATLALSHPSSPGHLCPLPATVLALSPRGLVRLLFFHMFLNSNSIAVPFSWSQSLTEHTWARLPVRAVP